MSWIIERRRYVWGGKRGLWQPVKRINPQQTTASLIKQQHVFALVNNVSLYSPGFCVSFPFCKKKKNVPSALSNGQGVGREKKTEMKQKEDRGRGRERERGGSGASVAEEQ